MTKSAVAKYQKRSDLPSIGVFGPQTKARLISELSE
jgi:peptidoglycan hydrolase-like protein with peptidoglycan-binding domain